jgi:hypothetical protein
MQIYFSCYTLADSLSSTVVIPSEKTAASSPTFKMEDTSNQQWNWLMVVGTLLALYGLCCVYNWIASFCCNFRLPLRPLALPVQATLPHPSKLVLPAFWTSEPAAWFMFAEVKLRTDNITNQRVMIDLLIAALPEATLAQVMDIINNILVNNPSRSSSSNSWKPTCCPTKKR